MSNHKGSLVFSTVFALTLIFAATLTVCAASVEVIDVKAGDEHVLALSLNNKDIVNGSIKITSVGRNIYFWITNPQGTKIFDYGLVTVDTSFQFTANGGGAYSLHFDNRFSSSRTITVSYSTYTDTMETQTDWTTPLIVVLAIVTVLLIAVIAYFRTRK